MGKIGRWYGHLAFRRKVLFSLLAVSLIPVIILGTFSFFQTRNLLIRREKEVLSETLKQNVLSLDSTLKTQERVMENLTWDTKIKQMLAARYKNNYEMYLAYRDVIDPTMLRIKSLNSQIRQISIYSSNPTLYAHGSNLMSIKDLDSLPDGMEDYKIHWTASENHQLELYCGIYPEMNQDKNVVYIQVDYDAVFASLTSLFGEDYGVLVADNTGKQIFSYADFCDGKADYPLSMNQIQGTSRQLDRYVIQKESIPVNGWTVYAYRPLKVVSASAWSITVMVGVIILLCIGAILTASLALTGSVLRPLKELVQNMDMIETGHLSVEVQGNERDEIGKLINRFGEMVKRLNCMVNEVYKSKIAQQQYEMRALQAQINPHFLYNSLSLINWKAIMAGQEEISEMTQLLSTFYRTTLNKGKNVTKVRAEWDNTCSYARIQNMLHSGKLELRLELEEGIGEYEMLNLLLQPLVENAIVHGLDYKTAQGGKILCVTGREKENCLIFTVSDNGCGISPQMLDGILTVQSKGYGVQNVHHRIQLYYGETYGLFFESAEGKGTRVTMTIPKVECERSEETEPPVGDS